MKCWSVSWKVLAGLCVAFAALARPTDAGEFRVFKGRATINGQAIDLPPRTDGSQPVVAEEWLRLPSAESKVALLTYWDRLPGAAARTISFIVIDFSSGRAEPSNPINSGQDIVWGDNNYVKQEGGYLHFGIFSPRRMQFVYRSGVLRLAEGPWMGPSEPERYIEPPEEERGPCFNVANVPECLAERDRYGAKATKSKSAPQIHRSAPPSSAPSGGR